MATKTYTLKYSPEDVAYELSAYVQKIVDGDIETPSIYRFVADRLHMRVDDLITIAQNDSVIGDLLSTLVAYIEADITDKMMTGEMDSKVAGAILRQPIFSWRDRSAEAIVVKNEVSYDEETRAAILNTTDPDAIMRLAKGYGK